MRSGMTGRMGWIAGVMLAGGASLGPITVAGAQDSRVTPVASGRVRPVSEGDGRVHGAPVMPVSNMELQPGQVQQLNLKPRTTMLAEFPYPVAAVHAGDADVLTATVISGKLILKATKDTIAETNLIVLLGDADFTSAPFRIRVDPRAPQVDVVRFTDPVAQHINRVESEIATRLRSDVDERVDQLSDLRLQQAILLAGRVTPIGREAIAGRKGDRLGIRVETAQSFPGPDGRPRLYLKYTVTNGTVAPLRDLSLVARVESRRRKRLFGEATSTRELADARDIRAADAVPPGAPMSGLLVLEPLELGRYESLSIEAVGFNGQRRVRVERVLVGER